MAPIGVELLYTSSMDRVRFGRALGFGARQAVKTLMTAADAVTAPNPPSKGLPGGKPGPVSGAAAARVSAAAARPSGTGEVAMAAVQAREIQKGVKRGSRRFGESVWRPFVRLSGVLWLEVSGVFFGIFALVALAYLWKLRGSWHEGVGTAANHRSLMGAVVMLALFGYFSVSSFVRARRRERRR